MEQIVGAVFMFGIAGVLSAITLGILIAAWATFEETKIGQYFVNKIVKGKEE